MKKTLIPCDQCQRVFSKPTNKITKMNFCSRKCLEKFNSTKMHNFNEQENPMNKKGRTIEERYAMRNRRLNAKDMKGRQCKTYNKHLGKLDHRRIMELKLGRFLTQDEVVHHIDKDPSNNKPSNLVIMTRAEHSRLHIKEYWKSRHEKK